ncbi:hypothetical protein HispidOSU_031253, partial [Sigmodon hispidus]
KRKSWKMPFELCYLQWGGCAHPSQTSSQDKLTWQEDRGGDDQVSKDRTAC